MKRLLAALILVSLPATVFAEETIREGLWEITTKMDIPGMPFALPPMTVEHCYTKEEVKDQKQVINTDKNCTVTDMKTSGNKVSWVMKCTGKNPSTNTGETEFSSDSFKSVMEMKPDNSKEAPTTMKVKAKRVGNCK